jgi:hypothetical protein
VVFYRGVAMAEVYQCPSCPPDEACGLDGHTFDHSYDECHHPLTLEEARLYAAASDLLEACKTIVQLGKSRYHDLGIDKMVEAAIAKAEGK